MLCQILRDHVQIGRNHELVGIQSSIWADDIHLLRQPAQRVVIAVSKPTWSYSFVCFCRSIAQRLSYEYSRATSETTVVSRNALFRFREFVSRLAHFVVKRCGCSIRPNQHAVILLLTIQSASPLPVIDASAPCPMACHAIARASPLFRKLFTPAQFTAPG